MKGAGRLVENKEGGDREETRKESVWGSSEWSIVLNANEWASAIRVGMGLLDLATCNLYVPLI